MDTSTLERHMKQAAEMAEKIQTLLPELRQIPVSPIKMYQGVYDFVINLNTWDDWKTVRRHFGKRLKPIRHHYRPDKGDDSAWLIYTLDGDLKVTLNVEVQT
jgi:hypothetical protein